MANTKNRKRTARERVARMQAQQRRAERRRNLITAAIVVVVAAAGIGAAAWALTSKSSSSSRTGAIAGVQTFTGLARSHVQGHVTYPQNPPVGGPHNPVPLTCGIYTSPVPNENAVHSLEHGAVWITYQPGLPASSVSRLQGMVRSEPQNQRNYTILSPYPQLPAPVVASAWGTQLKLNSATDPRLARFVTTYAQGPQTPEPGAVCSGVGTPTG